MRKGWVKAVLAVLCVLLLNVGVWGCIAFGVWEYNVPQIENFYESAFCWNVTESKRDMANQITKWSLAEDLSNYNMQQMEEMKELLHSEKTNFRYICYAPDGTVLCGNAAEKEWEKDVYRLYTMEITDWAHYDEPYVDVPEPEPTVTPEVIIDSTDTGVSYDETVFDRKYTLKYGVLAPLSVEDEYADALSQMEWLEQWMTVILGVSVAVIVAGLILLILLMKAAGRRPGREEVVLNWHDKIPYDLYLAVQAVLIALSIMSIVESQWYWDYGMHWLNVLWTMGSGMGCSVLAVALLLTTATRVKAHTIFRNTVIWRLCGLLWRGCKAVGRGIRNAINTLPLVWRVVVLFVIYLLGALITTILFEVGAFGYHYNELLSFLMTVSTVAWHGLALYLLCRWALQWKQMRAATQEIIAGKTDAKIECENFYPDLKEHAEQLGDLGRAIDNAVEERLKSERFKSELITNVSHDLKTPLTSIINYVDLLKKEEIENPTAREYIGVLDRKSQRLKKLTEDLVEASKASTGALSVNKDELDLVQLIRQALGEYEEKLINAGLNLVTDLPEGEIRVRADGRHVWRVLDNLLNNCVKYALEGTRVYLDAAAWNGNAAITVKNVSRNPLNIPAEQLAERFVRGDESRTTEGSGLGLSIARSLTELQGGQFGLEIDGDLFKAKVTLPLMGE